MEQQVIVRPKPKRRLRVQMDQLWSFRDDSSNQQWVWLAIDVDSREIVGCDIGEPSAASAQALWQSRLAVYPQSAVLKA